jgi:hypothetical protein
MGSLVYKPKQTKNFTMGSQKLRVVCDKRNAVSTLHLRHAGISKHHIRIV